MSSHRKYLLDGYRLLTESRKSLDFDRMRSAYRMIYGATLPGASELVRKLASSILRCGVHSYPRPVDFSLGKKFRHLDSHPNCIKRLWYREGQAKAKRLALERHLIVP